MNCTQRSVVCNILRVIIYLLYRKSFEIASFRDIIDIKKNHIVVENLPKKVIDCDVLFY